jgi:hypothetical protein
VQARARSMRVVVDYQLVRIGSGNYGVYAGWRPYDLEHLWQIIRIRPGRGRVFWLIWPYGGDGYHRHMNEQLRNKRHKSCTRAFQHLCQHDYMYRVSYTRLPNGSLMPQLQRTS